ncbi:MAG TPA: hypothetical protein VGN18_19155 [Jatrophihabitans sp.]|uniref:O-antigen ligase family protein n=1 Tax=Jatrophihabitans sp. TaxID=1932789 RepID=UPI002E0ACA77|nr:hypothetical protein [Jatrophihabitans sp.]
MTSRTILDPRSPSGPALPPAAPHNTGLARAAVVTTYLTAVATPWNGWLFGGLRLGDVLLLLALLLFAGTDLGNPWPRLPGWVWAFGTTILVVTVAHEVIPTDPLFLAQRVVVDAAGQRTIEIATNLGVGAKFLVPIVAMPLIFMFAQQHTANALRRCMIGFATGSAISAGLAVAQVLGVSNLATTLTGVLVSTDRSAGLTVHPNFLATTCVMALPMALWLAARPTLRERLTGSALAVAQLVGVYSSGSRGGAAIMVLVALGSFVLIPAYRRILPTVSLLLALGAAFAFVAQPGLGRAVLKAVRLGGEDSSVTGSDQVRAEVGAQGIRDFKHSPIDGVGLQVAAEAHNVYIQAMASGGLLLLVGLLIFTVGGLVRSGRLLREHPLAPPLFVAAFGGAVLASLENSLTDRLAYVPLALCAALSAVPALSADGDPPTTDPIEDGRA